MATFFEISSFTRKGNTEKGEVLNKVNFLVHHLTAVTTGTSGPAPRLALPVLRLEGWRGLGRVGEDSARLRGVRVPYSPDFQPTLPSHRPPSTGTGRALTNEIQENIYVRGPWEKVFAFLATRRQSGLACLILPFVLPPSPCQNLERRDVSRCSSHFVTTGSGHESKPLQAQGGGRMTARAGSLRAPGSPRASPRLLPPPLWLSETEARLFVQVSVGSASLPLSDKYSLQPQALEQMTLSCSTYLSVL